MKRIVITNGNWWRQYQKRQRAIIMRLIFSLAADNGYDISVQGQHWPE